MLVRRFAEKSLRFLSRLNNATVLPALAVEVLRVAQRMLSQL